MRTGRPAGRYAHEHLTAPHHRRRLRQRGRRRRGPRRGLVHAVRGWAAAAGPEAFAGDRFRLGPVLATGTLLFGRATWELFARRWPTRTDGLAPAMNGARKVVATRTRSSFDEWPGSSRFDGDLVTGVARLRARGDVAVVGSTSIVHQLAAHGLVDEYRIVVLPAVVGAGARLFADGARASLRLLDVEPDPLLLRYEVNRGRPGGGAGR